MRNTPSPSFDLTQRTVFGLLAQTLFGVPYTPESDVDWVAVYRESECQAVRLQTFCNHHRIPSVPDGLREDFRRYLTFILLRSTRIHSAHTLLHEAMTQNGIPYVILKGAASASYYPDPMTRAMGDVDFYMDREDVERAMAVLREKGFEVEDYDPQNPDGYHLAVQKDQVHMELHYRLPGIPAGAAGEVVTSYLSDIREQATFCRTSLTACMLPSAFHHGLIMLMHLQRHLVCEGIGLRHLCDWAVFVHSFSPEVFTDLFGERLKRAGLWRLARLLSLAAVKFVGLPEQPWMREDDFDEALAEALMCDIVKGGNFGNKDRQRAYEAKFMTPAGEKKQGSRLSEAIRTVNQASRREWPVMDKCPILLPIGWIVIAMRYLFRNRKRKQEGREIDLSLAYKNSEARNQLYQQLHLYEPEV